MSESTGTATFTTVSSISADELHDILLRAHAAGNVSRRRFIDGLRALAEQRLFLELGFASIVAYAETTFRLGKSLIYDFLRVSAALPELPQIAAAFESGELSWNLTSELVRVAEPDTDPDTGAEWLRFTAEHPVARTLAEIRAARKKGRTTPRRDGFGLPGLPVSLRLELSPEEHSIITKGFEKVAAEMGASLDGERPSPEQVLLFLMDRRLHTDSVDAGRTERDDSPYTVVFHRCTDCRRAAVEGGEGRVEVSAEALERFGAEATVVEIEESSGVSSDDAPSHVPLDERDRPNTPALRRALRARSGGRCENPMCRRQIGASGHGHHVVPRSAGGATALSNETYACAVCHACIHAGCLHVESDGAGGWRWTPRAVDIGRRVREELESARELPQVVSLRPAAHSAGAENRGGDAAADAVRALRVLGYTQAESERRVERAREGDEGESVAELVRRALRGEEGGRRRPSGRGCTPGSLS